MPGATKMAAAAAARIHLRISVFLQLVGSNRLPGRIDSGTAFLTVQTPPATIIALRRG
jgi:hypothetical protein